MQKRKVKGMPVIECIFFLSRYLKTVRLTINLPLLSFFCCPSDCYQCISTMSTKSQAVLLFYFAVALSDESKK